MVTSVPPSGLGAPAQAGQGPIAPARERAGVKAESSPSSPTVADSADVAQAWRGAREVVRDAIAQLDIAAAFARSAGDRLDQGDASGAFEELSGATGGGRALLTGAPLRVDLGDGAPPYLVAGADLVSAARAGGPEAAATAREAAESWTKAAGRLHQHERVLTAAAGAGGAPVSLDAQSAQLAALQVRQALTEGPGLSLSSGDPRTVLALFRE